MYTFCSNLTTELSENVFAVDKILLRGKHDHIISKFRIKLDSDVAIANPKRVVIIQNGDDYYVREKTQDDDIERLREVKRHYIMTRFEEKLTEGCMVLTDTKNFKMNCNFDDRQMLQIGLSAFKRFVTENGLDVNTVTENIKTFDNQMIPCTISEWEKIIADLEDYGVTLWKQRNYYKDLVMNAVSVEEINNIGEGW